jgi:hypothetical protein
MKARLIVSLATSDIASSLTDQPCTRCGGVEQRILRSKDDLDSKSSDSTSGKLCVGMGRGSLRSDNLKLDYQSCTRAKRGGLTIMKTKRYQFLLFNRKASRQQTSPRIKEIWTDLGMRRRSGRQIRP